MIFCEVVEKSSLSPDNPKCGWLGFLLSTAQKIKGFWTELYKFCGKA